MTASDRNGLGPRRHLLLALVLLALLSGGLAVGVGPTIASAPLGPHAGSAPAVAASSGPRSMASPPRNSATPTCDIQTSDVYEGVAGVDGITFWPFFPNGVYQTPCSLTAENAFDPGVFNDELHTTFSSNGNLSGTAFTVPVLLPGVNALADVGAVNDFYVGMVVSGDNASLGNQSYLAAVFTPVEASNGSLEFDSSAVIWSLVYGVCGKGGVPSGLQLTWDNAYACEFDDIDDGNGVGLGGPFPEGQTLQVTFDGLNGFGGSAPVTVRVNDTSDKSLSAAFTADPAGTGNDTFLPAYGASCPDSCYLDWGMPFGEGFGVNLGALGFNISVQNTANPVRIGAPEYWNGTAYGSDFSEIAFESASGACSGAGGVIPCPGVTNGWGYPYYQSNGTYLEYGSSTDYPWTTRDFGGVIGEFSSAGAQTDFDPLQLDDEANSSQVGYVPTDGSFTVTVQVQDFGTVAAVNLTYTEPDGSTSVEPMTLLNGTPSYGYYTATVPSDGSVGTASFSIRATSGGGTIERLPADTRQNFTVVVGPIPDFTITFGTVPSTCGGIDFGGLEYSSGASVTLPANSYSAGSVLCYPYEFGYWTATSLDLDLADRDNSVINVNLTADGTLTANFVYVRPYDTIGLAIDTAGCGSLTLNGTTYTSNTTVRLLDAKAYALTYSACALHSFSGWVVANPANISILGGTTSTTFTPHGNGTIVLTYLPNGPTTSSLAFTVSPSDCGGILFQGAGYTSGSAVAVALGVTYPIAPDPCFEWGFENWNGTSGVSLVGDNVTLSTAGQVNVRYYAETIVTIETYPVSCGFVVIDGQTYYNGAEDLVQNGSSHIISATPCAGYYFSGWSPGLNIAVSGDAMTVYGSGTLEAVFQKGTPSEFVSFITNPTGCGTVDFGGKNFSGSQFTSVAPNSRVAITAYPCSGYGFVSWTYDAIGITYGCANCSSTIAYVNGSGSIQVNFHTLVNITLETLPATCGDVVLDSVAYPAGSEITLPAPDVYSIGASACAHYGFAGWGASSGATVSLVNHTLTLLSQAIITAMFAPTVYSVVFDVSPGNCGGTSLSQYGAVNEYTNNTTVAASYGSYAIRADPCQGYTLTRWAVTGGLSVASNDSNRTTLGVNASGTLTAVYLPVAPSLSLAAPGSAYAGALVSFTAQVAVPVAPYTYRYTWEFGDGTNSTETPTGFVTHAYALTGIYLVRVTVLDPYGRVAEANATISIVTSSSSVVAQIGPIGYAALGLSALAVVAAFVLGRRRNAPSAPDAEPEAATPKPSSSPPVPTEPPSPGDGGATEP